MTVPDPATTEWVPLQGTRLDGMTYWGTYEASRTYNDGDCAIAPDGILYMCVKDGTVGVAPIKWPGASAPQGIQGAQGVKGDQGVATLIGAPIPWLVSAIPVGYREFNGSAIVQATHPILYGLFGATIPDLRGKFLLGAEQPGFFAAVGEVGGEVSHTLSETEMPSHGHQLWMGGPGHTIGANWNPHGSSSVVFGIPVSGVNGAFAYNNDPGRAAPVGGGAAHNNIPPYRAVRWITSAG